MSAPYQHNFSPFVFQIKNLPGSIPDIAVVIVVAVCAVLWFVFGRVFKEQGKGTVLKWASASVGAVALMYGAKNQGQGEFGLRWYSSMYLLGFGFCYFMCRYWITKRTIMLTRELLDSLITWLILGMILGARLAYVFIYNWDSYKGNLGEIFQLWGGGLSFHGGIVGVIAAILLFCKKHNINFWHLADKLSFTVPLGIGLGRIGNFINGELYGRIVKSDIPWAVVFPDGGPQPRHPSQLYQSLFEGWLLFLTLIDFSRIRNYREGLISVAFIGFYGFYRYFVEFFREADDQLKYYFSNTTTMGQILCFITVVIALTLYLTLVVENMKVRTPEWQKRTDDFLSSK